EIEPGSQHGSAALSPADAARKAQRHVFVPIQKQPGHTALVFIQKTAHHGPIFPHGLPRQGRQLLTHPALGRRRQAIEKDGPIFPHQSSLTLSAYRPVNVCPNYQHPNCHNRLMTICRTMSKTKNTRMGEKSMPPTVGRRRRKGFSTGSV